MKKLVLLSCILIVTIGAFAQKVKTEKNQLRHLVLFTFKASSTNEQIEKVTTAFNNLYGQIPEIKKMEWGLNESTEKLDQGFTHCFLLTFNTKKDLSTYIDHPAHKAFQAILNPHMDKVFVVDYFVGPR